MVIDGNSIARRETIWVEGFCNDCSEKIVEISPSYIIHHYQEINWFPSRDLEAAIV